jgi:outer membrane receptor protein involved in Fe transport
MTRNLFSALLLCIFSVSFALAQTGSGEIRGTITDATTGEPIPFANIIAEKNGVQEGGASTDFDGKYSIKPIGAGKYDVKVSYVGYKIFITTGVVVSSNKTTYLDPKLSAGVQLDEVEIVSYTKPLLEKDNTTVGGTVTAAEIAKLPTRNVNSVASTTAGIYQADEGGGLNVRGSRSDATQYYIDGIRVIGGSNSIPQSAIEELSVITGGVPAQYGDVTGGVVSITTKGPSRTYFGGAEVVTSQFLDPYGYNLADVSVSGPLLKKNKGTDAEASVLGFFISTQVSLQQDPSPSALGYYKVKDEVLADLEANPLRPTSGGGTQLNAEYLRADDLQKIDAKRESENLEGSIAGKIDFQPRKNVNFTVGGSGRYFKGRQYIYDYSLLNFKNNPEQIKTDYRVYGRFTQKFKNNEESGSSSSLIKNAFYQIQADFSKSEDIRQHNTHKDNLWDYGYVGKFETYRQPIYEYRTDSVVDNGEKKEITAFFQTGIQDTLVEYSRREVNPLLANYTSQVYDFIGDNNNQKRTNQQIVQNGALLNGGNPQHVYSLWFNTGRNVPGYNESDDSQFRLSASASADIKDHAIKFGIEYEQRIERSYGISPQALWGLARQLTNKHITTLDTDAEDAILVKDENGNFQGIVNYNRRIVASEQAEFDKNLRAALGVSPTEFIDIDALDPSTFAVNMFSADELLNNGSRLVGYTGYTFDGIKTTNNIDYFDFFEDKVNRPIAPWSPIYTAGYIQDKFSFRDLIFNVGVRVDRFDANTKVLKDRFSLYDVRTAGEVAGSLNSANGGIHPANIGADYVVYVDDPLNPSKVLGYRSGQVFFDAAGTERADPTPLRSTITNVVTPYLSDDVQVNSSNGSLELSRASFKDYEPQLTIMPRIAFSFPISDEAVFFANYDVLAQRPRGSNVTLPYDYFFLASGAIGRVNNPDLKPEKTTNYQLGFKQKLSNSSAMTLTSFYRELKDNIQLINVSFAYPVNYNTYDNVDFGTSKGFTVQYDLRRTNNIRINASYTLSFAEGTGSSSTSAGNLIALGQPNLRIPTALSFDQRHNIVTTFDYRYGAGREYDGPESLRGLLETFGANLIFRVGSGTPFTKQSNYLRNAEIGGGDQRLRSLEGSINGSRLPWQFKVDLRLDRDINIGDNGNMNVYLLVQNVTNAKNITNVYRATGNPDDDGFLTSNLGEEFVSNTTNPQSYLDLYSAKMDNPAFYTLPRIIRVGLQYSF